MSSTATMATHNDSERMADPNWWRQAAVYQIYPRSFSDANGDGLGDIKGITAKVPYLKSLGIDAVWLSPFYPSALADGGYDVDDYRNVDPKLGTLADFDEMAAALHAAGIKLIADIVPNHSSDRHECSRKRWRHRRVRLPVNATSSATAWARTASCPRRTGTRFSAARPGSASPNRTAPRDSGTCTSSPRSSRTSTGTTPRFVKTS
ncbi:alpha-glucosidase [Arthrobacter sp. Hiyo1]|nr:alpha-glucosidase [Arthrobacter sp. Hiyo1]